MVHPIRPRRLAAFVAVCVIASHLILGVSGGVARSLDIETWTSVPPSVQILKAALFPYSHTTISVWGMPGETILDWRLLPLLGIAFLAWPLSLLAFFDTLKLARVRRAHLLRGLVLSMALLPLLAAGFGLYAVLEKAGLRTATRSTVSVFESAINLLIVWSMPTCRLLLHLWPVVLGVYWFLFLRRYLRLPRAGAVFLLMLLMWGLAVAMGITVIYTIFVEHWTSSSSRYWGLSFRKWYGVF